MDVLTSILALYFCSCFFLHSSALREATGEVSHGVPVRDFLALLAQINFGISGKIAERKKWFIFFLSVELA